MNTSFRSSLVLRAQTALAALKLVGTLGVSGGLFLGVVFSVTGCANSTTNTGFTQRANWPDARPALPVKPGENAAMERLSDADLQVWEANWFDAARARQVPARIFAPLNPEGKALPLIVFSHGLGNSRLTYTQLGKYWASQGFVSLHLQHLGSDRAIWTERGFAVLKSLRVAASIDNAVDRARDVSFGIDQALVWQAPSLRVEKEQIAVAGHSFGANTALMSVGAQFLRAGKLENYGDPRIRAAIILSPPSLPKTLDPIKVYNPIRVPTMHLTGTRDDTPIPGLSTMANERSEAFDSMVSGPRYLGVFEGGRHSMFHDRTSDATSTKIKASAKEMTTLFLKQTLFSDSESRDKLLQFAHSNQGKLLADWQSK